MLSAAVTLLTNVVLGLVARPPVRTRIVLSNKQPQEGLASTDICGVRDGLDSVPQKYA